MRTCNFSVPGNPIPRPEVQFAKLGKFVKTYIPDNGIVAFKAAIVAEWLKLNPTYRRPFTEAVSMRIVFWFPRPQSMVWKAKPMLALPKISKPDLDNLEKGVMDALEKHAYKNDSMVVEKYSLKWYVPGDAEPRTDVCISEFGGMP